MAERHAKTENVAAVLKVFGVLESMVDERWVSLADLAQRAMTSKTTTHRLLQTMVDLGYVEQHEETEKYGLTLKLFSLGARLLNERSDLMRIADKAMGKLSRAIGESINLGILDERDQRVVYIHKYDSFYNLSMKSTLGLRNPLHSTSLGKALVAWCDEDEIRSRIAKMDMKKMAPRTITDPQELFEQFELTRSRGFAEEIEESEAGVRCIAAPIFNHLGKPIAAISIGFPLFRFEEIRKEEYVSLLRSCVDEVSAGLGYQPTP